MHDMSLCGFSLLDLQRPLQLPVLGDRMVHFLKLGHFQKRFCLCVWFFSACFLFCFSVKLSSQRHALFTCKVLLQVESSNVLAPSRVILKSYKSLSVQESSVSFLLVCFICVLFLLLLFSLLSLSLLRVLSLFFRACFAYLNGSLLGSKQ